MAHATSLRVIGQSLEAARLTVFELRTEGEDLLVETEALTQTAEWILRRGLHDQRKEETDRPAINQTFDLRHWIFLTLTSRRGDNEEPAQHRTDQHSTDYHNCSEPWASILIGLTRRAFTFYGGLMLYLLIPRPRTGITTSGLFRRKNSSS